MKIAAYLVSIGLLLCLAFLYGWRFLHKISLDWPLTLTTQLLLQNFLTTLHKSRSKSLMKSSLEWVTIKHLHALGFFFVFYNNAPKSKAVTVNYKRKKYFLPDTSELMQMFVSIGMYSCPSWHIHCIGCTSACPLSCDLHFMCILRVSSLWHHHFAGYHLSN